MNIPEMLSLILIGFILRRVIKSERFFEGLRFLVNEVLFALFVFGNVASKNLEYLLRIKLVFLYVFLVIGISLSSSFFYSRLFVKDRKWMGALMVLSSYPNTAALGFPIASLFLKDITPAILYSTTNSLIILPIVTFIAAHFSSEKASIKESFKKALRFPPTLANLLALSLVVAGIRLPDWFLNPIKTVGWMNIPLLLIYFGSRISLGKFSPRRLAEVATFRSIIPFLFVFLTLRNAEREIFYAVLVEASMPPAIAANAILAQYRLKAEEAISVTFVWTLIIIAFFSALNLVMNG
ncbi:AEC family transporter [Pyrococcus sp. ST04]|uniref:AEC family transporter n=1 Tax=Pyrococcus sp. ST04 TaxID=1183377 RepID=UPI0002605A75|nr:AEC family transporter [Pyrococcus sp. ST04]AFK22054.1 putative permease auxin efflux carrier family protein [Pyrococcus sp. ST04]